MPQITFQDVVSYPAYMEHTRTISADDLERMRRIVSVYDTCRRVRHRILKFGISEIVNNGHYMECCWADPACNSDPNICLQLFLRRVLRYPAVMGEIKQCR